ncbi:hypothetical protein EVAR_48242_1 [Eumeta japonica]|uniref:Uncharacterized protein n=1 Tax=Eumeta variegata TaxID=151549 RepID=A0A4C1YHA4_EUMVA|nr:hypothetical protein EVAR_48242_1 [Eumeta japonica]
MIITQEKEGSESKEAELKEGNAGSASSAKSTACFRVEDTQEIITSRARGREPGSESHRLNYGPEARLKEDAYGNVQKTGAGTGAGARTGTSSVTGLRSRRQRPRGPRTNRPCRVGRAQLAPLYFNFWIKTSNRSYPSSICLVTTNS